MNAERSLTEWAKRFQGSGPSDPQHLRATRSHAGPDDPLRPQDRAGPADPGGDWVREQLPLMTPDQQAATRPAWPARSPASWPSA